MQKTNKFGYQIQIIRKSVSNLEPDFLNSFSCDNEYISSFLKEKSQSTKRDVTYAFIDKDENKIIGFYSLCANGIMVTKEHVDKENGRSVYRTNIPVIMIDFFAIDEYYRSTPFAEDSGRYDTLSKFLFTFVLEDIRGIASTKVGATHVCLYSVPESISFYKRNDFKPFDVYMQKDGDPHINECTAMFYVL